MAFQEKNPLLNQLKLLLHDQFEELVFHLSEDIDRCYLPERGSQMDRAITLIRLLEQQSKLGLLKKYLDDLDWFKEILPAGAYPVGQKLREREEARERRDMEEAETRGEDPEDYQVTPEKFYTFRPEAAWLGVFRGWDAPRSFHSELVRRVVDASRGRNNCPAAAIIGQHGGSGKSVALRRLAVDLAEQGYKVWWVDEAERLLQSGLSKLAEVSNGPQFLLVDDIHYLEDGYAKRFRQYLQKNRSLIMVVAGRGLPNAFRARVASGSGLFDPYEADDRGSVLTKIAETIPEWADTAKELATEPLQKARLIRILVVLARRKAAPRNLEELETAFFEILTDDISKIRSTLPGLADAVIDAAAIREVGPDISRETFIALAKYHQPGAAIPTLLEEIIGNRRWQVLESLSPYNPEYDTVQFHHDELAEGIILAGQHGLLGSRIIGDDAWREATLDMVINRGSKPSSSYALSGFVRNHPSIISQERALKYIDQLIAAGNGHHAYLRLIVDEALDLDQQERMDLLLAAARVVPYNRWLWGTAWGWIQRHYQKKEQRCEVLEQLYQAGCQSFTILIPFLQDLPDKSACIIAKKLLTESNNPFVLCACLRLLDDGAKGEAKRLLADKTTHPSVLCACLSLLGYRAKDEAKILLEKSRDPKVLCACLNLLGDDAKDEAKSLLEDKTTHPSVLCACLYLLGYRAKDEAKILLEKSKDPQLICACLNVLGDEAKDEAKSFLGGKTTDPTVLCACLNLLSDKATDEAKRLLTESKNPDVHATCLKLLRVYTIGIDSTDHW